MGLYPSSYVSLSGDRKSDNRQVGNIYRRLGISNFATDHFVLFITFLNKNNATKYKSLAIFY
ncbi:MAG: hypothetical protein J7502_19635 [Flavisolibacter sp.]|nr:hypothetical protein [Flavisolibacter sp.]